MSQRKESWFIPVISFAFAILLAWLAGPASRALGLRAAAAVTGPAECSVNPDVGYTHSVSTGNPKPTTNKITYSEGRGVNGTSGATGKVTITANNLFVALANNDVIAFCGSASHRLKMLVDINGDLDHSNTRVFAANAMVPAGAVVFSQIINLSGTGTTTPLTDLGESSAVIDGTVQVTAHTIRGALLQASGVVSSFSCAAP